MRHSRTCNFFYQAISKKQGDAHLKFDEENEEDNVLKEKDQPKKIGLEHQKRFDEGFN